MREIHVKGEEGGWMRELRFWRFVWLVEGAEEVVSPPWSSR